MFSLINRLLYKAARKSKGLFSMVLPRPVLLKVKNLLLKNAYPKKNTANQSITINNDGVNLIGYSRAEMGIGESCRIAAKSLNAVNYPFGIMNFVGLNKARMSDMSWISKEIEKPIYDINIIHLNAEQMPEIYNEYGENAFASKYNIGVWHWELPDFPDRWVHNFNLVDEIWAPSFFIMESISKKSPVPVVRIPHSIEVKIETMRDRSFFNIPLNVFVFLCVYDVNSYHQRKNPQGAIVAFKLAFAPDDESVALVIKINVKNQNSKDISELNELIGNYKNIIIISETLSRNDMNALISVSDCFVSLHRSEGFGLVLAEAMYLGKPVIATGWSSNVDFMNTNNSCLVDYKLITLGEDYGPYEAYQYWAEPSIEHASFYYKKLREDEVYRTLIANRGQETIKNQFSPKVVGEMMKKRIEYIRIWNSGG